MIHSKYTLYVTKQRLYLVASCLEEIDFQIIKIDRTEALSITHDSIIYTKQQIITLLSSLHDGNIGIGGLTKLGTYLGIIGIVRFLHGYYLLLVCKRSAVSLIGGHYIYHIDDSTYISLYL
jgi:hypothetical protein